MRSIILQPGEEVVTVFRQSPAVLALPASIALLLVLAPVWYTTKYALFGSLKFWLSLWMVLVLLWFSEKFILWRREKYIVTPARFVNTSHENVL